jgi:hypothetical protein
VLLTALLQFGLLTFLPWAVLAACAAFSLLRVESLSD